ncbi:hypothetical protein AAHB33_13955 [Paenarthrobacter sp. S56]|uniref:hypothetical protein n=1 Tax=Paenarthrobacter sp. S56 TaxID=3138179 RepID=UPI00321937E1
MTPTTHPETTDAPTTSGTATSEPRLSKPLGSWELNQGVPKNMPTDLPVPEDRWLDSSTNPFDSVGGMVDLWVSPDEMETLRHRLMSEGWKFVEPDRLQDPERIIYTASKDNTIRGLYFGYTYASESRDAQLTITYTKHPN